MLCVGHDLISDANWGAAGVGIPPECYFWRGWIDSCARAVRHRAGVTCRVRNRREEVEPWGLRQVDLVQRVNQEGYRLVIDMHYNAYNAQTAGVVAIHHPSSIRGKQAAGAFVAALSSAQGTRALPLQARSESWGGSELTILTQTDAPTVILEPFFGDVPTDVAACVAALRSGAFQSALADTCADLIAEWG